ncbi:hypothetical protein QFC22_000915 [Naganishia vaughanmartiniae]|uniref:Uncharacterized protein n=1 Tax=Naganishia vaughanmartiniae TaxID=1424756 RepID=A0ACC2XJC9_9TREE|nr:hypothetical protein QFC22_000915 [Naganishia vaughanmartiniae]
MALAIIRSLRPENQDQEQNVEYLHRQFPLPPSTSDAPRPHQRPFSTACLSYIDEEGTYYRSPIDQLMTETNHESNIINRATTPTMLVDGGGAAAADVGKEEQEEEKRKRLLAAAGLVTIALLATSTNLAAKDGKHLENGQLIDDAPPLPLILRGTFLGRLLRRRNGSEGDVRSGTRNKERQRYPMLTWLLSIGKRIPPSLPSSL